MPGGTRTGRSLAYCTVHWRIRARSARPDNRRKNHQRRVAGAGRSSRTSGSHGCPGWSGTSSWSPSRAACTTSAGPDEVNTALPEFLISQPGGTCRQSPASP